MALIDIPQFKYHLYTTSYYFTISKTLSQNMLNTDSLRTKEVVSFFYNPIARVILLSKQFFLVTLSTRIIFTLQLGDSPSEAEPYNNDYVNECRAYFTIVYSCSTRSTYLQRTIIYKNKYHLTKRVPTMAELRTNKNVHEVLPGDYGKRLSHEIWANCFGCHIKIRAKELKYGIFFGKSI